MSGFAISPRRRLTTPMEAPLHADREGHEAGDTWHTTSGHVDRRLRLLDPLASPRPAVELHAPRDRHAHAASPT